MENKEHNKLYDNIDNEEDMSDSEKRDAYFSAMADQQDYEDWMENG